MIRKIKKGEINMAKNMNPKPDDRSDNAEKIEFNIGKTIQNMEMADEMIQKTDDEKAKRDLKEKNKRREDALSGMREEIRDEAKYKKNK
jgi:small acid-soluble spore protein (thioredoxin-like protein)